MSEWIEIPGGSFTLGSNNHYPEEAPEREGCVGDFLLRATTTTNREWAEFANDTGYKTLAERPPGGYPEAKAGSLLFRQPRRPVPLENPGLWWRWVPGASWKHPRGVGSDIDKILDHPVVHIAWQDAKEYARWAGARLPSEEEWERAARGPDKGGDSGAGQEDINHWIGTFPHSWIRTPGRPAKPGTCSVRSMAPSLWGLYQMCGNVWEWTSSLYRGESSCGQSAEGVQRVLRGGSFLCADNYCSRYRPSARIPQDEESATSHIGFRLARDPE